MITRYLATGLAVAVTLAATIAWAQGINPRQQMLVGSVWSHNGSIMYTSVNQLTGGGASFTINYAKPRAGMRGQGVRPDTVVFTGHMTASGIVTGTAFTFRKGCAPAAYAVEGAVSAGPKPIIVLNGHAPRRAKRGCQIVGYATAGSNANLRFDYSGHSE